MYVMNRSDEEALVLSKVNWIWSSNMPLGCCRAVRPEKVVSGIVLMLGQEPGTMKLWMAVNAKLRSEVVKNGSSLGIWPSTRR